MAKLIEQVSKNGQLDIHPAINDAKLIAADKILEGVRRGEHAAVSEFKYHMGSRFGEAIHTTGDDFIFAFAALTAFDDRELNIDRLVTTLHEIQVSIAMLIEQLARNRNPDVHDWTILDVVSLHQVLQRHHPSLQRH